MNLGFFSRWDFVGACVCSEVAEEFGFLRTVYEEVCLKSVNTKFDSSNEIVK